MTLPKAKSQKKKIVTKRDTRLRKDIPDKLSKLISFHGIRSGAEKELGCKDCEL